MQKNKINNKQFSSKIGFIMASVGSAVGMGNIWMFPYRVGQYGGAVFLLLYFAFVALFGTLGLSGEFALGRLTKTGPIGAFPQALKTRGKKGGKFLGVLTLLGILGIAIGYAIIVGWVLRFLAGSVTGSLFAQEPHRYFEQITGDFGSIPWHVVVVLLTVFALLFGVLHGIEKVSKIMMPAFFILFFILAIRVAFLPGATAGYRYLFVPQWEYLLKPMTWIMAMGQAFFSLSITGSGMVIYGSYLDKKEDIVHASVMTAILDTCAALLAAFAIIPAVFAFGINPSAGPSLMFISMPKIFAGMPLGRLFSVFFFLSVLFAGITSLINMMEACIEALQKNAKLKRYWSVLLVGAVVLLVGLFIENQAALGAWMDAITIYVTPTGAVLGAIMIYWVYQKRYIESELNLGRKSPLPKAFFAVGRYGYVPLAILVLIFSMVYGGIG